MVYQPQKHTKKGKLKHCHVFARNWQGPLVMIKCVHANNENVYVVYDKKLKREFTANVNRIKLFSGPGYLINSHDDNLERAPQDCTDSDETRSTELLGFEGALFLDSTGDSIPRSEPAVGVARRRGLTRQEPYSHPSSVRHRTGRTINEHRRELKKIK